MHPRTRTYTYTNTHAHSYCCCYYYYCYYYHYYMHKFGGIYLLSSVTDLNIKLYFDLCSTPAMET